MSKHKQLYVSNPTGPHTFTLGDGATFTFDTAISSITVYGSDGTAVAHCSGVAHWELVDVPEESDD